MQDKYILDGKFTAGTREHVVGPLVIYVGECSLSVMGTKRVTSRSMLSIAPFHGGMFFGTIDHLQREVVLEKGYELVLSGTTLGVYDDGGGKEGDFDIFRIKDIRIKGTFGPAGLTINIHAHTWAGSAVCYGSQERRENIYEPIEVTTEFIVPPKELQAFMKLGFPINHEMFEKFNWSHR